MNRTQSDYICIELGITRADDSAKHYFQLFEKVEEYEHAYLNEKYNTLNDILKYLHHKKCIEMMNEKKRRGIEFYVCEIIKKSYGKIVKSKYRVMNNLFEVSISQLQLCDRNTKGGTK